MTDEEESVEIVSRTLLKTLTINTSNMTDTTTEVLIYVYNCESFNM